jgi:hypothetical protein
MRWRVFGSSLRRREGRCRGRQIMTFTMQFTRFLGRKCDEVRHFHYVIKLGGVVGGGERVGVIGGVRRYLQHYRESRSNPYA